MTDKIQTKNIDRDLFDHEQESNTIRTTFREALNGGVPQPVKDDVAREQRSSQMGTGSHRIFREKYEWGGKT